jgi:hypothetical protein
MPAQAEPEDGEIDVVRGFNAASIESNMNYKERLRWRSSLTNKRGSEDAP